MEPADHVARARRFAWLSLGVWAVSGVVWYIPGIYWNLGALIGGAGSVLALLLALPAMDARRRCPDPKPGAPLLAICLAVMSVLVYGLAWLFMANFRHN